MSTRLTPTMREIMRNIRDGKSVDGPSANKVGNGLSDFGGGVAPALTSLRKRGLITAGIPPKLTKNGEQALAEIERKTQ